MKSGADLVETHSFFLRLAIIAVDYSEDYLLDRLLSSVASRSKISLNKCSQKGASSGIIRMIKIIPTDNVTGKPMAKTDNCGETRFNKPSARFRVSNKVISGNASLIPLRKIKLADSVSAIKALPFSGSPPIGSV